MSENNTKNLVLERLTHVSFNDGEEIPLEESILKTSHTEDSKFVFDHMELYTIMRNVKDNTLHRAKIKVDGVNMEVIPLTEEEYEEER